MPDARQDPESVAERIADDLPVDWDAALRSAPDEPSRRILRRLRLVESVRRFHRSGGDSAQETNETVGAGEATGTSPDPKRSPEARSWGHLELREKLGEGGFGEVHRAWDPRLDREVALKLLRTEESRDRAVASKVIEEGRLLAKLRHPNVVTVHGAEVHDGRVGVWMELIRGRSLDGVLRENGPFGAREATLIGIDVCRALAAVHAGGIVHRDVKGQNVMREEGGRILLMDFGAGVDESDARRSGDGTISGTPLYMAPELLRGEPATRQSDIYALGVLLYRLVTGSYPVEASTWCGLRDKHERGEVKLLRDRRSDLPEAFVKVVERATAREPGERFGTAGQMEQALTLALGVEAGAPPRRAEERPAGDPARAARRRRTALLVATLAGIAALVAAAVLLAPLVSRGRGQGRPDATGATDSAAGTALAAAGSAGAVPGSYAVEAALYRTPAGSSSRARIEPGARLALMDRLTLEFKASAPLHVYVIDEDDAGHAYALFPLPGLELGNPLPPGAVHVLPGARGGVQQSWVVSSPGGRERILVLASPTRLVEFEAEMGALARAGESAVPIPETAMARLRGIGGLADAPRGAGGESASRLFEMAQQMASRSEVVHGVWLRRIELENPGPR